MEVSTAMSIGEFSKLLSVLRNLPLWIIIGLAFAGYAVLFIPPFGGITTEKFRQNWGVWVWVEAITFSILAIVRVLDAGITYYWANKRTSEAHRFLRFVPLLQQNWWHLAKQQDDSYVSQISFDMQISNVSENPVQIVKVRLIRPKKTEYLHAEILLPMKGSPYHSHKHPVPPCGTVRSTVHIMVRGKIEDQGSPLRITLGITDQYGEEYKLKNILIRSNDKHGAKRSIKKILHDLITQCSRLINHRNDNDKREVPIIPWTNSADAEYIGLCTAILNEEKRQYAARGRRSGGLGSLNVTLQSEPNLGWTMLGDVQQLLWGKNQGKIVASNNLERLFRIYKSLSNSDKDNMERYLLSQLQKQSPFVEVAYFVFLSLHRMGRTIDALKTARSFLAGDKVFGYSNLLGTLSAIISHEHFNIDLNLYSQILEVLDGDDEYDFKLREKINLAKLERLDCESRNDDKLSRT